MIFYKEERMAIFIDGANLYAAARSLGFDIDYRLLLKWAAQRGQLVRAYYYTALAESEEYSPIRPLVDWLDYNGFTMVTKPVREFVDAATGRRKIKGNMDIDLVLDVMEMSDRVQHVVLFSGDGDFRRLMEVVQRKGVRTSVVSTMKSNPPMVSDELRRQVDNFIDLADIAHHFQRAPREEGVDQGSPFYSIGSSVPPVTYESIANSAAGTAPQEAANAEGEVTAEKAPAKRGRPITTSAA